LVVEHYLRREGIKYFDEERSFWNWANRTMGAQWVKQFSAIIKDRAQGNFSASGELYNLFARPEAAIVVASFEYGLLIQIARWVEAHLPMHGKVIELGCHTGLLLRYYASLRPEVDFIGVDFSEKAIFTANKKLQEQKVPNLRFEVGDVREKGALNDVQADLIITGRVMSELMSPTRRMRLSWEDYQYEEVDKTLDGDVNNVLENCKEWLVPYGELLVVERLSDYDRINRLWLSLRESGFQPDRRSLVPISWKDMAGSHSTWFFCAQQGRSTDAKLPQIWEIPLPSNEVVVEGQPTRLMFDGILAWQTWCSLADKNVESEETFSWDSGEDVHYEVGGTGSGMGYVYIATNTDIHLLTLFLLQEKGQTTNDLVDYVNKLKQTRVQGLIHLNRH
jgi:SAM-dependent methyltransferase